jgi:spore germination protein YaaH
MEQRCAWLTAMAVALAVAACGGAESPPPPPHVFAFVSRHGGAELERLSRVGARIDIVAPNWYALEPDSGLLRAPSGSDRARLLEIAQARRVRVWPAVNARTGGSRGWERPPARARIVASLRAAALAPGAAGVTLDMEELVASQRDAFTTLVREAAAALHAADRKLAVYVSRTGAEYDWKALARHSDLLLSAGYNESWAGSRPGAITTPKGFDEVVDRSLAAAGPRKAVPLLGAFGYRWPRAGGRGELIGSDDALRLRRRLRARAQRADGNERFSSAGEEIVYATAAGLRARWRAAQAGGARWIGLFSLGREPAHFWDGLKTAR